jgi:hypothetical protein
MRNLAHAPVGTSRTLASAPPDSSHCRVCGLLRDAEAASLRMLVELLRHDEGRRGYAESQGLCLRHMGLLIAAAADEAMAEFLLTQAARRFEEWSEDMQGYAMKREGIRNALINRDEEDAHLRAIMHLVGERNVCAPWETDGYI